MSLVNWQKNIEQVLGKLKPIKKCRGYSGRFSAQDIKTISTQSGTVLVSCLGLEPTQIAMTEVLAKWAIFCIGSGAKRDEEAQQLAAAVFLCATDNRWDYAALPPQDLRAENLHTSDLKGKGVALWAVTFAQAAKISPETDLKELKNINVVNPTQMQTEVSINLNQN